ncbi:MAG: DNA-directed RNA polymerase subunit beta' [Oscillospiraceae bacterium]|jgi:DNA-directed RNA polymerase subunit beta'|nr:DNA-directed RNA polymerase subunit beta' [Oscillospiraceae bacterium]
MNAQFDAIQIGIASPDTIRSWSRGEVKKPETINYRTLKPERDGLFCERIFGPIKDWECHCGKYKKIRYKGKVCDRCGVEITRARVRRERMGHVELAAPVSHIWYFKGIPSRMGLMLDISPRMLEKILYFSNYIVTDPGDTPMQKMQVLTDKEYRDYRDKYEDDFQAGMGAEAIKALLREIDCDQLADQLRGELKDASGQKKAKIVKRLEVVEAFRQSGNRPEWMIMDVLPVIPPDIRPMVQLDGGRFATSDLNDLYRRVINRNNRLRKFQALNSPDIIVRNEKRMLQEAVDALIDNGRRGRAVVGVNSRVLKSLSDMLKGKQGRFRQNLLGKRVDYSGRSVIVVGPDLKLYQCGLPKEMAIELFRPFVMKKLVEDGHATNIKSAKKMVDRTQTVVWDALDEIIKEHPVLLNRAPTLHRLGIQAFEPVLVEGRALKLHPLVCTAYNADFDGDQMAVHVPLSYEAQSEARILMLSANNLLRPQDGKPVTILSQDMVLGAYYLTYENPVKDENGNVVTDENERLKYIKRFRDTDEAILAYDNGIIDMHDRIIVRRVGKFNGQVVERDVRSTIGRILYNESIPQDLGYVDRNNSEHCLDFEIDFRTTSSDITKIVDKCITKHGFTVSTKVLDDIKGLGFKYSTKGAITISIADIEVPEQKQKLISDTEQKIMDIESFFKDGEITDGERSRLIIDEWEKTTKDVADALQASMRDSNPIFMMVSSGARGSRSQISQLAGMRGLMADTAGRTIEVPIKASFREGLSVLEYFISSRGSRKGLADTALRTADSGYLTRRMVDVSQDVIIREPDCGTHSGITAAASFEGGQEVRSFAEAIHGRFPSEDILNPATGEVLFSSGTMLREEDADVLESFGIHSVKIRSVLECKAKRGVCSKCYGMNLATGERVSEGEAVGVIAAQSIGEPGTQLTMRTFHTGGVAGDDITQGLPRVEELFEARKPKKSAVIAEISGTVKFEENKRNNMINVTIINEDNGEVSSFMAAYASLASKGIHDGGTVKKGDVLTDGSLNPHDVLKVLGVEPVQNYLIREVQKVYKQQAVDINDKHIEVVVRQMMRKSKIEDAGDTALLSGSIVDTSEVMRINDELEKEKLPADYTPLLMGITKASLATESFLSAASFQETTKVLTEAAIRGKIDHLNGLKENVIIGKLIPAGSGLQVYRDFKETVKYSYDEPEDDYDFDSTEYEYYGSETN